MSGDFEFTPGSLRELIATEVLKKGSGMPGDAALERLAFALNGAAATYRSAINVWNIEKELLGKAILGLKKVGHFIDFKERATEIDSTYPSITLEMRDTYAKLAEYLDDLSVSDRGARTHHIKNWSDMAGYIGGFCYDALHGVNPELGTSNHGPVARLVRAVIMQMGPEKLTIGQVSKRLKELAKLKNDKVSPEDPKNKSTYKPLAPWSLKEKIAK